MGLMISLVLVFFAVFNKKSIISCIKTMKLVIAEEKAIPIKMLVSGLHLLMGYGDWLLKKESKNMNKKWLVVITSALLLLTTATTLFFANESLKKQNELAALEVELLDLENNFNLAKSEITLFQTINSSMEFQMANVLDKREQERVEFAEALEIEGLKATVEMKQTLNEDVTEGRVEEVAGFLAWETANEVADYLYEDSDGKFEKEWGRFLTLEALDKDIDPFLIYELLRVETGGTFSPDVVGPQTRYGRAYGLAQFMKNTGPWVAEMADLPYDHDMLFDPLYSIQLAVTYLDFLYNRYGDWDQALTAYHRGIYGMKNYVRANGNAKSWYAVEIQEAAKERDDSAVVALMSASE
nr:transglycosylase SLT domain-containing protein [Bacillus alkalicola]